MSPPRFGGMFSALPCTAMLVSILQVLAFVLKVVFMVFVFIWVRWTIPRFRYDQLMNLGWKVMLPLAIANLVITALVLTFYKLYL